MDYTPMTKKYGTIFPSHFPSHRFPSHGGFSWGKIAPSRAQQFFRLSVSIVCTTVDIVDNSHDQYVYNIYIYIYNMYI